MIDLTTLVSCADVLMSAPDNVDPSQTVIDLLLAAMSDAGRMQDASLAYDALAAGRSNPGSWYEWMANQTGVGTPDDYREWLEQSDHWPTTPEDFQDIEQVAEANDPFFRFYHGATGRGWDAYSAGAGR